MAVLILLAESARLGLLGTFLSTRIAVRVDRTCQRVHGVTSVASGADAKAPTIAGKAINAICTVPTILTGGLAAIVDVGFAGVAFKTSSATVTGKSVNPV